MKYSRPDGYCIVETEKTGSDDLEDSLIIELFNERSEQAIVELTDKYGRSARCTAANILNSDQDVEECMNDTNLAVWNSIPPERPENLRAYYTAVTRNTALSRYRSNTAKKRNSIYDTALEELEECLAAKDDPSADVEAKELSAAINAFLKRLSKEDRQMFVCRYWLADTIDEIAAKLQCKSSRVSLRLFRTREKLRTYLIKEGLI